MVPDLSEGGVVTARDVRRRDRQRLAVVMLGGVPDCATCHHADRRITTALVNSVVACRHAAVSDPFEDHRGRVWERSRKMESEPNPRPAWCPLIAPEEA